MCEILPYIEQDSLARSMYANPWPADFFSTYRTPVNTYLCPSDPRDLFNVPDHHGAPTSYLGVTGSDNDDSLQTIGPTNGIFNVASGGIRITDITDGTSNTLMVGERPPTTNLRKGWWGASDYDTLLSTRQL
jgi:hypothetical protein